MTHTLLAQSVLEGVGSTVTSYKEDDPYSLIVITLLAQPCGY